jgi:selenide,water dikinase
LADAVTIDEAIAEPMVQVLFDPQTSGGLLMAVPKEKAVELERRMTTDDLGCWRIGEVVSGSGVKVRP